MNLISTTAQRLERADRDVEELKRSYLDALEHLREAPEVDTSFDDRWANLDERLRALRTGLRPEDYDKPQLAELYRTLFEIRDLMDENRDLETLDRLLVLIEQVRQVIRDALDEHVNGVEGDTGLVVEELGRWLPTTPRDEIARLVGRDRRTLSRWAGKTGPPARRLVTVARLVAILQHNWTEEGVVAWFHHARRELHGRSPLSLLNEPNYDEDLLLSAARAGRSQYAS